MNVQVYTTEEEQLEVITNWLKKYGNKLALAVTLIIAGVAGQQYWQSYTHNYTVAASSIYEKMQTADEKEQTALANQLVKNYKSTVYGKIAVTYLANQLVVQKKWPEAIEQYNWVYSQADSWPELKIAALENIVRSYIELKQFDKASASLAKADKDGLAKQFPLNFYNLKGDLLSSENKNTEAVTAYNVALEEINKNTIFASQLPQYANLITLKRNDLLEASELK